ncbi:DUF484 family protein [Marinobacter bohaiensis]|uniref:DUF484 family protein n=1 Tax=Marinobacter bohaiensis TaxID=2201898 RepID=UPI000DACDF10|nr:DUF484 family protein [Marinobacter bohaiensis]
MSENDNQKSTSSQVESLIQRVRHNEAIASKLFDMELAMMQAPDLSTFADRLTEQARKRFDLDDAWFVLTDIDDNRRIMELMDAQGALSERLIVDTQVFFQLVDNHEQPLLSADCGPLRALIPAHLSSRIQSLALLPLQMEGRPVGALVLGAADPSRYQPGLDAFFLRQLAVKTSAGLTSIWAREQLKRLATRDPLTGLRNRREMESALAQELSRGRRQNHPITLLFLDLDRFKAINDELGHEAGDACLIHVTRQLQSQLRRDDSLFRFAGDEFVALLPGQEEDNASRVASRMQNALRDAPFRFGDSKTAIQFSYGMASVTPEQNATVADVIRLADQRLYEMKRAYDAPSP